ncbi:helix-turn-helix transcriptional regulator [Roseivivax sp. THAF30]|uniref:helix-turn-helix domain-containing protein n=1 Tax=Roseivivax sp. THAF30 TaxID=2587852 RepID=UPI00126974C0|nr:helix-turn-helix transcriptional regulator [Roseivivax sp. THAF30]QFT61804.1 Helix-turn-helix protein [Roseivivax sp. THAF30]
MGVIRDRLRKTRPDVEEQLLLNADKRAVALEARRARKLRELTVEQVAEASGLSPNEVSAIEAPAGELPSLSSLKIYAEACGAKLRVRFETTDG